MITWKNKETHETSHSVYSHIPMLPFTLVNLIHLCQNDGFINQTSQINMLILN